MDLLLERQRPVGLRIIGLLSGGAIKVDLDDEPSVEVRTQIDTNEGRPDLELRGRGQLAVVEVKVESDVRRGQFEGYRRLLQASGVPETKLVLLTRYPFVPGDGDELPDLALRWYEVADWFESELRQGSITARLARSCASSS